MKKILSLILAIMLLCSISIPAFADTPDGSTIDLTRTGSINLWKYDLSSAEMDGVWDSSYVSTGVRDENGVEAILGNPDRVSPLNPSGEAYGYAIKGVQFTYLKVASLKEYTVTEGDAQRTELLYGIAANEAGTAFLSALGLSAADRFTPADEPEGSATTYYFRSDVLIDGLKNSLDSNATTVKNALEAYVVANGGTAMAETDAYGHSEAKDLPLGLYLFVETKVPEMVTETTAPFLISLPMTTSTEAGSSWSYDIALYPKNLTGIPSLEKTLREAKDSTGKNNGSTAITDGFAHTGTASIGDTIDYQIISTLPSITSATSYLTDYSFVDTLSKGLNYKKGDVVLEFFKDAACTDKVASWKESDNKFTVSYSNTETGDSVMSIGMTAAGLTEINTSKAVYTADSMVNSGYSDCTLRITYAATVNGKGDAVCGDAGNDNDVVLTWKRSNTNAYDTLIDDCHLYVYGMEITKRFSDGKGDASKVEFICHNDSDNYYLTGALSAETGIWYVTGHTTDKNAATHFKPSASGKLTIKGMEDDTYSLTEVKTDAAYTLLKAPVKVVITKAESTVACDIYSKDVLGLLQNDSRYKDIPAGQFNNIPQKQLAHKLLTATAKVDNNAVNMDKDGTSNNAVVPFTVINTRGFDLPQTGGTGNWMFPVIGLSMLALCIVGIVLVLKKKPTID